MYLSRRFGGSVGPTFGSMFGLVLLNGNPDSTATISWTGPSSGSIPTDINGEYFVSSLTPGTYTVSVSYAGVVTITSLPSYVITITVGVTTIVTTFTAITSGGGPCTPPPLPGPGLNGQGHFSGRILFDTQPYPGVVVKVVDAFHPNWILPVIIDVLDTLFGDGFDPNYVKVTTTDAAGNWSVTGLTAGRTYMLKIFPPDLCAAFGEIPNPTYITAETGYIDTSGNNFMSTNAFPAGNTYQIYSMGRYLFDMPVHVFPTVPGALNGSIGYSDLNVEFHTRTGSFPTSFGIQSGCIDPCP